MKLQVLKNLLTAVIKDEKMEKNSPILFQPEKPTEKLNNFNDKENK